MNAIDLFKAYSGIRIMVRGETSEQNKAKKSKHGSSSYLSLIAKLSDEKLETMSIQALNRRLRKLPQGLVQKVRKRRRILKNRKYALKCRKKNSSKEKDIIQENKDLQLEISKVKEELKKVISEKKDFEQKCATLTSKLRWIQSSDFV